MTCRCRWLRRTFKTKAHQSVEGDCAGFSLGKSQCRADDSSLGGNMDRSLVRNIVAKTLALCFLLGSATASLRAQHSASQTLLQKEAQLQAAIDLLAKSKAQLPSGVSQTLRDAFDSEIKTKQADLASLKAAAKGAAQLESNITKLTALEAQLKDQSSPDFLKALHAEIQNKQSELAKLLALTAPSTPDPPATTTPAAAAHDPVPAPSAHAPEVPAAVARAAVPPVAQDQQATSSPAVTVSVSPTAVSVQTRANQQFTATVTGANDTTVTWSVNNSNGGNTKVGKIDTTGLYTAPDTAPNPSTVSITATSEADSTQSASASVTVTGGGGPTTDSCTGTRQAVDCRSNFEASAYAGLAIDTFAVGEVNKYLNPNDSNKVKLRGVGGFDFAYRLFGGPCSPDDVRAGATKAPNCNDKKDSSAFHSQLWVYGETVHGVRSADVDCKANPNLSVCKIFQDNPAFTPDQTLYILRNATSLEAFAGLRFEFLTLNPTSKHPANLYLKSQAGFLTVAGAGKLTQDHTSLALGAIATSGRFRESYLDFGYGRTKLFAKNSNSRWKIQAYLTWDAFPGIVGKYLRPFAEMDVDTDLGPGADSVQSYYGVNFDVDCIFRFTNADCNGQ